MDIQIITVYNNNTLFEQMKESIYTQSEADTDYCQIVALDNTKGRFRSAAEAYNYVLDQCCKAEILVFCHQDILFFPGAIERITELCGTGEIVLYGAAGVKNVGHAGGEGRIISCMGSPDDASRYSTLKQGTTEDVFTLDECLIAANRALFDQVRFDENACFGWHLYAAELSMQCHLKGIPVKVFDANVVHLSGGTQDKTFYQCERRIVKKYRRYFPLISYTCGWAYTNPIKYYLLYAYRKLRFGMG